MNLIILTMACTLCIGSLILCARIGAITEYWYKCEELRQQAKQLEFDLLKQKAALNETGIKKQQQAVDFLHHQQKIF